MTIILHGHQIEGKAAIPFNRVRPRLAAWFQAQRDAGRIDMRYLLEWGPEYEDSKNGQASLASSIPFFVLLMVLMVVMLFNNLCQSLIIWLTVPLAMIGVTMRLLLFNQPFNFMAILGTLSLAGMLIKNAIVLIDEMTLNLSKRMAPTRRWSWWERAVSRHRSCQRLLG